MKLNATQVKQSLAVIVKSHLVAMIAGSPGIGKSSLVREVADDFNLKMIDVRLAQSDPTEINGFPYLNGAKAGYVPMDIFPIEGDALPEGKDGWLIFLDELTSASEATISAAYKLILDRMVGQHNLHSHVVIVAAGNLDSDNAIVNPMGTAMQSRLIHLELASDNESWLEWAYANDINHVITDYIKFRPGNLNNFNPDHTDNTFACQRTWEFANRLLQNITVKDPLAIPLLAGALSEGVAREFVAFTQIYDKLPKMNDIINTPDTVTIPDEPSILYALSGYIAHNATTLNLEKLMKFILRIPAEFQAITLREIVRRDKSLYHHPALIEWKLISAAKLF